jgi:imidazolonepropionase-like amidohydrolase
VTAHISTLADTQFLVDHGAAGFLHTIRDTEQIPAEFITRLRDLRLVFTPTLVREEIAWLYREHPERLDDPELKQSIDADVIAAAKAQPATPVAADFALVKRNNKRLADGGVPIAVGSDGGSSLDFPGLMTHRELELLVESGLSPSEVVVAATRNGALALGKLQQLGTIAPGKRADLLMVGANPLEDIRNLRKIDRVMLNGAWVDRARLSIK